MMSTSGWARTRWVRSSAALREKPGDQMNATQQLHGLGQSLGLERNTRSLYQRARGDGLTSNPTIFDHAIKDGEFYDDAIRRRSLAGKSDEALFFELATEALVQAADPFRPIHDATGGVDGWVSLEVSPSSRTTPPAASRRRQSCTRAGRAPQSLHQDPGDSRRHSGGRGIDLRGHAGECDAAVLPEHYIAAAEAYDHCRNTDEDGRELGVEASGMPARANRDRTTCTIWPA